jgi:hypothetical protein
MTFRFASIAALAIVYTAAPAFAHGSGHGMGGNGMNQSMPSHMISPSIVVGNHNSTGRNNRLREDLKVATFVGLHLASLSKQLNAALQAHNQALVIQILDKLKALSLLDAKFGLTSKASLGNGQTIEIGVGAQGDVAISGMATGT